MNVRESRNIFLQEIATIAVAFLIGTFAMIYNNDKSSELFVKELSFLSIQIKDLKEQIKFMQLEIKQNALDRWTRSDHNEYAKTVNERFKNLEKRMIRLEQIK